MTTQIPDTKDCVSPKDVAHDIADNVMPTKAGFRKSKLFVLAIAAGALIAFGAQVSLTVMTGTDAVSFGIAKLVGAMVFSTGLMMVVLTGSELFTGNVMMTFSVIERKTSLMKLLRNWGIVYFGNFVGSLLVATLVYYSGICHNANDMLGVTGLTTAYGKVNLSFVEALTRGILCNWLVCLAIWMATSSRRVIGKIFAIFFPITTFVASGYEHSIANMFFIPNGILMKTVPSVVQASGLSVDQLATLTPKTFILSNLVPVTIGNILGAFIFVVLLFWTAYLRDNHKNENAE